MTNKDVREIFARILSGPGISVISGAHDALSARLVEQAGFAGIWASSFGMSLAARSMPDLDLVTMTEHVDIVRAMVEAVENIPVVVDASAGYGGVLNVRRVVRELERAGAAAVCIEDNEFPKRCSLYPGWKRTLLSPEDMVGKVRAAQDARHDDSFKIIARVESLIAGRGPADAWERAKAYARAGADGVLIHSREAEPLLELAGRWDEPTPLVVVPTMFPHVSVDGLAAAGFRVCIFPNQAIRASVRAMQEVLATLRKTGRMLSVDNRISTLAQMADVAGVSEAEDAERRYLPASSEALLQESSL